MLYFFVVIQTLHSTGQACFLQAQGLCTYKDNGREKKIEQISLLMLVFFCRANLVASRMPVPVANTGNATSVAMRLVELVNQLSYIAWNSCTYFKKFSYSSVMAHPPFGPHLTRKTLSAPWLRFVFPNTAGAAEDQNGNLT